MTTVQRQALLSLADITTDAGKAPALSKTVSAQFLSGAKDLPLTFKQADASLYEKAGTVVLVAEAEGYNGTLLQNVTVTGEGTDPQNPDDANGSGSDAGQGDNSADGNDGNDSKCINKK